MSASNKVWFITGCSTGFGRELACEALSKGDNVVVTARNISDVQDIINTYPGQAIALKLDVTRTNDIKISVEDAILHFGKIDVLVNNAGIGYFASIEESDEVQVRRMFEVNFFGLANLTREVLPHLRKQKGGHIINFSSIGGLMSFPSVGFYNATKFALEGYSEALAKETTDLGIKVMLVEPGPFRTDWAGRSAKAEDNLIPDYIGTDKVKHSMRSGSGSEPGDPVRAAKAIFTAVNAENPPLRLLLGAVAYNNAIAKISEMETEFTTWKGLSLSADFPTV